MRSTLPKQLVACLVLALVGCKTSSAPPAASGPASPNIPPDARESTPAENADAPAATVTARWVAASAGDHHTCGIQADGTLWCWGDGREGELGLGEDVAQGLWPEQVGSHSDWTAVSASNTRTCALRRDRSLWCWGDQMITTHYEPTRVGADNDWVAVATGRDHTCGLRADRSLWCWGGRRGGPGSGYAEWKDPTRIELPGRWAQLSASGDRTCGVQEDGSLWCWPGTGSGLDGSANPAAQHTLQKVDPSKRWRTVQVGLVDCAIRDDATLWCWGEGANAFGWKGGGAGKPQQVGAGSKWASVTPGFDDVCAVREDGSLWCWRRGRQQRVGEDTGWTSATSGRVHSCALKADGTLWCWGDNRRGATGVGHAGGHSSVPGAIETTRTVRQLSAGAQHACLVASDDTLWCWGHGAGGTIGDDAAGADRDAPAQVAGADWSLVSAGGGHTCALKKNGTLWCWGNNQYGQLGFEIQSWSYTPGQVAPGQRWTAVSTGNGHTCAIREDRTLWCWGLADHGQLGAGDEVEFAEGGPVRVGSAADWLLVAAGGDGTCGLREGGTLWCWGDGEMRDRPSRSTLHMAPQQVGERGAWSTVSRGGGQVCAVKADRTLWCWGNNENGRAGAGDLYRLDAPTQVLEGAVWASVSAGGTHTCALRPDGALWCWGANYHGQLGAGETSERMRPTRVGRASDWVAVAAGTQFTMALRRGGRAFSWGQNHLGQLGDGRHVTELPTQPRIRTRNGAPR